MRKYYFLVVVLILAAGVVRGQNAIIGNGFAYSWNNDCQDDTHIINFIPSVNGTYILTTQPYNNNSGDRYFSLAVDWDFGATIQQRATTTNTDQQLTIGQKYHLLPQCNHDGTMYINAPNGNDYYIFKTLNAGSNPTGDFVVFRVQGSVQSVTSVSQSPVTVEPNDDVTITANLSGAFATGQSAYLRYTIDGFATSTVVEMTGSGSTCTATIPSSVNGSGNTIEYYVFTSGAGLTIPGADADLFTINYNTNGVSNYSYSLQSITDVFDDFDRASNNNVGIPSSGGSVAWTEYESISSGARINGASMWLQSGQSNEREAISFDMTEYYPVAFDEATEDMQWAWNMHSNRSNPSGFTTNDYGSAFILGSNKPEFDDSQASGYAVILGQTGSSDPLRLVRFEGGLSSSTNFTTIASVTPTSATEYFSVKVTYNSCTHNWRMDVREESIAGFTNPSTGLYQFSVNGTDDVLTATELPYLGAFWKHATGSSFFLRIDSIYIPESTISTLNQYTWAGGTGDFNTPSNWSPSRTCPRNRDVLIFDAGTSVVQEVPDQTIGQVRLINSATVRLEDPNSPNQPSTLTLTGGSGEDLRVDAGSSLIFDVYNTVGSSNGIIVKMLEGVTGEISGTLRFDNTKGSNPGGRPHQLLATDTEALHIKNGGRVEAVHLKSSVNPFGDSGNDNTIIFESGSVYRSESGGNPFGFSQPQSKVIFETGSKFQFVNGYTLSFSGRKYADFEFVSGDYTQYLGGGSVCEINNMIMQAGSLNLIGSTNSYPIDIEIKNDLNMAGGTLDYSPDVLSNLRFNGTALQRIYGNGTLIFGDSLIIEVANTSIGTALQLERNIDLHSDLSILDGKIQSQGPHSLNMLGSNSQIVVGANGSIEGTNVGENNDLTLNASGVHTSISGTGAMCKFYNVNLAADDTLSLNRSLEVQYGTFDVADNAKLIINHEGAVLTTSPTYAASSQLIYNAGESYGRGTEWTSNETNGDPGYPGNVIIQNQTILSTDNSTAELGIQNDLIIGRTLGGTGTLDMHSDTHPIQVGGDLKLAEGTTISRLTLSSEYGGDIKIKGDFIKVADDAIGIFEPNEREVVMNGASQQNIIGVEAFDYLAIVNSSGGVSIQNDVLINNRLRLGNGMLNLNSHTITMTDGSEIMRESSSAILSGSPTVNSSDRYDLRYTGALTTGVEWLNNTEAIRDLIVEAAVSLNTDHTYNRDLYLNGADLDLNGNVLTARGIATDPDFSGEIKISQPGNRSIHGLPGSRFDITGVGGTDPGAFTKQVVNEGANSLIFGSNVEVRIGNGGVDFGSGNPTLIKGVLAVRAGGYVINNACNYAPASVLRFANSFDYQVDASDLTWASGAIESGSPGIPYNVEVINDGTDLTLNSPRALRNSLTITDGKFTLTSSSGTFDIGGNWIRTGSNSAFNHNDQEVIFNGSVPQTISTDAGEIFYRLSFDNTGIKTLNEDVTVLENLNIRGSGALNGNTETITLIGNWNNEVGTTSFTESQSKVIFAGNGTQIMDSPGGETFYRVEMNNSDSGLVVNNAMHISNDLSFTDGIIHSVGVGVFFENNATTDGGKLGSYVNGKVTQIGTDGNEFKFPVGYYRNFGDSIVDIYQPAALIPQNPNTTSEFSIEYYNENYVPGTTNPNNPPPTDASVAAASTCNYWLINRENGSAEPKVKLYYTEQSCIEVEDASLLTVVRWTGPDPSSGAWDNQLQTGYSPSSAPYTSGYVLSGNIQNFSPFTIGSTSNDYNVLPIQLLSFTAFANNDLVETHWVTSTEINNDYFTVERSVDAVHFEEVGRVEGAGNSTSERSYALTDKSPYAGLSYYRLKQTDYDGNTTFSEVRSVKLDRDTGFDLIRVYRSVSGVKLRYQSDAQELKVEVFDMLGKRLYSTQIENNNGRAHIYPSISRGIYLLRLSNGDASKSMKFFY